MTEDNKKDTPFEIRFYLTREFADAVRGGVENPPGMESLTDILNRHGATLNCQLDEFEAYVAEMDSIEDWETTVPDQEERAFLKKFVEWTRETISDEQKRAYLSREFSIMIDEREAFDAHEADGLFSELQALEGGPVIGKDKKGADSKVKKVYMTGGQRHGMG